MLTWWLLIALHTFLANYKLAKQGKTDIYTVHSLKAMQATDTININKSVLRVSIRAVYNEQDSESTAKAELTMKREQKPTVKSTEQQKKK